MVTPRHGSLPSTRATGGGREVLDGHTSGGPHDSKSRRTFLKNERKRSDIWSEKGCNSPSRGRRDWRRRAPPDPDRPPGHLLMYLLRSMSRPQCRKQKTVTGGQDGYCPTGPTSTVVCVGSRASDTRGVSTSFSGSKKTCASHPYPRPGSRPGSRHSGRVRMARSTHRDRAQGVPLSYRWSLDVASGGREWGPVGVGPEKLLRVLKHGKGTKNLGKRFV